MIRARGFLLSREPRRWAETGLILCTQDRHKDSCNKYKLWNEKKKKILKALRHLQIEISILDFFGVIDKTPSMVFISLWNMQKGIKIHFSRKLKPGGWQAVIFKIKSFVFFLFEDKSREAIPLQSAMENIGKLT